MYETANWNEHIVQGIKSHRDQDFRHHWFNWREYKHRSFFNLHTISSSPKSSGDLVRLSHVLTWDYILFTMYTGKVELKIPKPAFFTDTALQKIIPSIKDEISRTWILTEHRLCDIFTVSRIRRYHNFDLSKNSIGKWPEVARQRKTARWKLFIWKADNSWDQVSGNTR